MPSITFYSVSNTCDHDNIKTAGEILVVMDEDKKPIWHHDLSDEGIDLHVALPRDLIKLIGSDPTIVSLDKVDKKLGKRIDAYLSKHGY